MPLYPENSLSVEKQASKVIRKISGNRDRNKASELSQNLEIRERKTLIVALHLIFSSLLDISKTLLNKGKIERIKKKFKSGKTVTEF